MTGQQKKGLGQRGGAADALSQALGFTTNATSVNAEAKRARDTLVVDRQAARIRRMQRAVGNAARMLHFDAHCERHAALWNKKFLTLTYAGVDDWQAGHISDFRKALWHWCKTHGVKLRFVWVAELQQRGALHYHVVLWLPKGKYLPMVDACGWWPHGRTNIVTAQSPIGYITKYASKTTVAQALGYPKGARMFGHGGLPDEGRRHMRYWLSPIWVRQELGGHADIRKVTGGYVNRITGEYLASPWRVVLGPGGQVCAFKIDIPITDERVAA